MKEYRSKVEIEVDQSIKIENTAEDTVLAFSNDVRYAIVIPAALKREALSYLQERGKSRKVAVLIVFAAALFLLLRDVAESVSLAIIDQEYSGYDALIKDRLLRLLWGTSLYVRPEVFAFDYVGKRSRAHDLAVKVHRGKLMPNHRVTRKELLEALK